MYRAPSFYCPFIAERLDGLVRFVSGNASCAREIKFHVSDETSVTPDDSLEGNLRARPFRNML